MMTRSIFNLLLIIFTVSSFAIAEPQCSKENPACQKKARGWITIASIGPDIKKVSEGATPEQILDIMMGYWKNRIAPVLPDQPDLIVLPETCDRPGGLSQQELASYYEFRQDKFLNFFADIARKHHCYITYPSYRILPDGTWRNSMTLIGRDGNVVGIYDKNHPTIGEIDNHILPGTEAPVFECDFGRLACAICFDLNFDQLRQQYVKSRPDIIVFPSMYHGGLMQAYWAYSCRAYFVGACSKVALSCEIRSPTGDVIASSTNYRDYVVARVNLDCAMVHLDGHREKLATLKAQYGPQVTIYDPGRLGSVLVSSDHPTITANQMLKEFDIEPLDDFLNRCLEYQENAVKKYAIKLALRNNLWVKIRLFLTRQNSLGPQRAKLPPCCPNLALCPNCFAENNKVNLSPTQNRRAGLVMYPFVI